MKVLVFHIGDARHGLRLAALARVLPAAQLTPLPLTPPYVAGLLDLHGVPVPVIDLARLAGLEPDAVRFDTRIIVVDYPAPGNSTRALGLLAERVQGITDVAESALADSGVRGAPFLGQVAGGAGGMLQLVELEGLLPPEVRALLFQPAGAAP